MNVWLKKRYHAIPKWFPSLKHFMIGGLLAISAITNILLAGKVKQLRATISSLKAEQSSTPGMKLPPIIAQDVSGQNITIRFDEIERPTLLYVFSPSCGWCKKNEDNIRALASQTGNTIRIIGVSLSPDGLDEYVAHRFPPVRVIRPDVRTITAYKLSGTPETILVSPEGVVLKVWKGAYGDTAKSEVEEYFHIKLPGLRQTS